MTETVVARESAGALPVEVTSFVGRRFERSTVRNLLAEFRLVTLTGFGGIGKTRLAMRMAGELRRLFPDGTFFVQFGALEGEDDVSDQVAEALGLAGRSLQGTSAVVDHLRERTVLVVLDNCEHVIDAAALLAETVLRTCPGVRILATSREPLRVDGEVAHAVSPLTLPGADGAGLGESEAAQLLLDRARASAPGFTLDDSNREAVAEVCRRLEGIPLAIELAAARLTTLSPRELARGLTDQWELLSRGRRTAPRRQTTMAACIEWSFELCTPAERRFWARASVFVDGFEYDAAEAVCGGDDLGGPVRELLASLVDKSVLGARQGGATTRFRMLPPLRQRGLAELDRLGELDALRGRHRAFHLDLAARAHAAWLSSEQLEWIDRIRREQGNLAEALEQAASEPAAVDAGLLACAHLQEYLHVDGLFRQGRRWSERLLSLPGEDPAARALALRTAAAWAAIQGDLDAARPLLEEGQRIAAELGGELPALLAQTAGLVAQYADELGESERFLEAALAGLAGNGAEAAHCWMLLAINGVLRGDPERAVDCHRESLRLTQPVNESWCRSWSLWAAGIAAWLQGEDAVARARLEECLRLEHLMGETIGIGAAFEAIAWLVAGEDPERAGTLMGAAQRLWDDVGASLDALPGLETHHRAVVDRLTAVLGKEGLEHALAAGRALDQAAAVALCLAEEPERAAPVAATGRGILTRRERQIADLIHEGLSNRQIAERLVISQRTAEGHVEHILTKLGFTSRTQVAAWVAENQVSG